MKAPLILFALFHISSSLVYPDLDWYKTASFYQIYPQSFYDGGGGNRNGFGTFKGIKEKLDYIKDLGVDCIWLTPIFESSYIAMGYDITNYEDVDLRYGTKEDFKELVDAIHEKNLRIIVDFVPNHCGYQHEFFKKSMNNDPDFKNWFVWAEGKGPNKDQPPSNWQSIGGGLSSAWSREVEGQVIANRSEYFYGQFSWIMPDFNFREPAVLEYWEKFMKMWLDFGLDGFRIDAISHGYEFVLPNGTYPDEPRNENVEDETDFTYLKHIYTQDLPELFDLIYDWREFLDTYNDTARIMMTESYSPPVTIMQFYKSNNRKRQGAHLPFNFQMIQVLNKDSKAKDIVFMVNDWFKLLPEGEVTNWAIGNHDQSRVATRFGVERIDILNTLVTMLPGTSVTYYGEEIGMEDACVYYNYDRNLPGFRCNATYQPTTRARCRTPMQWDNTTHGGFTKSEPWLPIGEKYQTVNVVAQTGVNNSHLEIFKSLQAMRKNPAIQSGDFKMLELSENAFGFKRELLGDYDVESIIVLINFGNKNESVKLDEFKLVHSPKYIIIKIVGQNSAYKINEIVEIHNAITLGPYESIVAFYNHGISAKVISNILLIFAVLVAVRQGY